MGDDFFLFILRPIVWMHGSAGEARAEENDFYIQFIEENT